MSTLRTHKSSGRFIFAIVALSLGQSVETHAESLNLTQALQAAQVSPKIEKAKSQANEASYRETESWSGFLPTVTGDASYLFGKRYFLTDVTLPGAAAPITIPGIVPTTSFTLGAQLPIFDGFASTNRLRAARASSSAAHDDFDWAQFQIQREVTGLFYKAIGAKALKEVAEKNLKTLEDHLRDVKNFKNAGVSTNYDVLRVEVQVSEAKSEVLNTSDAEELARGRLDEALGISGSAREPEGQLPVPTEAWAKGLERLDTAGRKDLAALVSKTEALARQDAAAGRHWIPKVSLFGNYTTYNNKNDSFNDWDSYRGAYQVGISAHWTLFDGLSSISKSREATEQRVQAEKSLRMSQLHAAQDFNMWRRKFLYQCDVFQSRNSDVAKATEAVRLAKAGRKAGVRTNTELLDAETDLFRAQAGVVNAQIGAIDALLNLELATGRKLADFSQEKNSL